MQSLISYIYTLSIGTDDFKQSLDTDQKLQIGASNQVLHSSTDQQVVKMDLFRF